MFAIRRSALPSLAAGVVFVLAGLVGASASVARADVTHVVQHGHTIDAIAHRYHVSVKAILEANHLKDGRHLKPGQTLVIPGVEASGSVKKKADKDHGDKGDRGEGHGAHKTPADATENDRRAARDLPPEPRGSGEADVVHAVALGEQFRVRVKDGHGHIPPSAIKAFEHMMRQGNATHPADPRLIALVGIVSNHFGGKPIEVVSGYRAVTAANVLHPSNHNRGKALDFRIHGVSNEALRDFCRTLRNAGCGYYPNSTFVHLDVRDVKAYWVDRSRPGEPPKYDGPNGPAEEGASDVPDNGTAPHDASGAGTDKPADGTPATPDSAPSAPAAPAGLPVAPVASPPTPVPVPAPTPATPPAPPVQPTR